jgi:hypothetical protein
VTAAQPSLEAFTRVEQHLIQTHLLSPPFSLPAWPEQIAHHTLTTGALCIASMFTSSALSVSWQKVLAKVCGSDKPQGFLLIWNIFVIWNIFIIAQVRVQVNMQPPATQGNCV